VYDAVMQPYKYTTVTLIDVLGEVSTTASLLVLSGGQKHSPYINCIFLA